MSEPINDGGSAFPHPVEFDPNGQLVSHGSFGMSLRDYLAAKAMVAICCSNAISTFIVKVKEELPITISSMAYSLADAMLSERNNRK